MNPPDVILPAADVSLWALFIQAHFVVKTVMIGLMIASVWVWAIVVDKTILYTRTRREIDRFEQIFWSGQNLEELYQSLSSRPTHRGARSWNSIAISETGTKPTASPNWPRSSYDASPMRMIWPVVRTARPW
jgi:hypothetical protein